MLTLTIFFLLFFSVQSLLSHRCETIDYGFTKSKVDFLKAILPFFIILHHLSGGILSDFIPTGKYVVGLFFFISGYGLEIKRTQKDIHIRGLFDRLSKLLLPLIIPLCLYLAICYAKGQDLTIYIISSFASISFPLPNSWFVMILMLLYFVYYIVAIVCTKRFLLCLFFSVLLINALLFIFYRDSTNLWASNFAFVLGTAFFQIKERIK